MAYLSFKVPFEAAEKLSGLYADGDVTDPADMHITVAFLSKNMPPEQVIRAIAACYSVARMTAPFAVHAALLTSFPPNPSYREGVPVIVRVLSDALHSFQARVCSELDRFGVEYSRLHPEYKPHVTLSHGPERVAPQKIEPVSWICSHLMIWGGDDHFKGLFAGVELAGRL